MKRTPNGKNQKEEMESKLKPWICPNCNREKSECHPYVFNAGVKWCFECFYPLSANDSIKFPQPKFNPAEEKPLFSREAAKLFNALTADDWTVEDWADLHQAIEAVKLRVAQRHGIK